MFFWSFDKHLSPGADALHSHLTTNPKKRSAKGESVSAYSPQPQPAQQSMNALRLPSPGPRPKLKSAKAMTAQNRISAAAVSTFPAVLRLAPSRTALSAS